MATTVDQLRRFAVARSLFRPTTLGRALDKLGFLQADPIRSPARAQDLTLRHRVKNYVAGDLERRYPKLDIEEEYFVNYGFVTRSIQALMHPRSGLPAWPAAQKKRAAAVLEFVREKGAVHPRTVDEHFAHGSVKNYWGGQSSATTRLLDALHYRGLLRVVRRDAGIRVYSVRDVPEPVGDDVRDALLDALVDVIVQKYAPLPGPSLSNLVHRLRLCVPQWHGTFRDAFRRGQGRLAHAQVDGVNWYWPADERPRLAKVDDAVRFLAPFDPVVWDRRRFEIFWGWAYRFEAYTPEPKRKLGYYALPLLWRDQVIGWGNFSFRDGTLHSRIGYAGEHEPDDPLFRKSLEEELERMAMFLRGGQQGASG